MKKWIITLLVLSIAATGCQPADDGQNDEDPLEGQSYNEPTENPYNQWGGHNANVIANHLAHLCTQLPEVSHATAVVLGPYAVVGLDIEPDMDQSDAGQVKYAATETLADDPYGAEALVTADPDITARLNEMQKDIADGKPVSGIMEELAAIVGRLMPVTPGPEHRKDTEGDPSDVNDDRLNNQRQNELEDVQNKQSKGRKNKLKKGE
ncbi:MULTISPECIES: YhcN/YlaJ family sporulation lipoprotein [Alteribacter]|uniref:YhcN/YlaJ family sporulation lipoprotein n=1 Tax=Alteribacter keqinensis TaxID=2483800 RepID=A0A3M7TW42_9BACI|nr:MULTISPECIES: YhcN/YlaJ family sporulation lipoprotein [Alteribacter]MBM7095958.1 YhcN/YlaJ family sporulation lipoprotein [Alteribacter salitolerans]RNA69776.1 YhcN/YlaJ family sporulation lipoprotein [Alteribacter keqinensis]